LVLRHLIPSAYRPVLANRVFGRLLLGFAISYLGDGMSFVAVAWLAIELAPQSTAGRFGRTRAEARISSVAIHPGLWPRSGQTRVCPL
jgi:hypothetical protein